MPYTQNSRLGALTFYVRTSSDPAAMSGTIRSAIQRLDANLPVMNMRTLTAQLSESMFDARLVALLSISLALLAALIAALGLYGLLSYVVARRTREIGVRMALGASRVDLTVLVVREALMMVLVGVALGVPIAIAATRGLRSLLFHVTPLDPVSLLLTAIVLLLVAGLAAFLPARRATKVDPMVALRYE
jgi:ABC-type antimicrobial peptide transport system permease subunit